MAKMAIFAIHVIKQSVCPLFDDIMYLVSEIYWALIAQLCSGDSFLAVN